MTTLRVIGYCRVSTQEQGDSGAGLAAQRAAIEAWCTYRNAELVRVEQDIASGKTTNGRHGLERALAAVEGGEADVLAVAKLDRLSRSVADFAKLVEESRNQGWRLVALDVDIDTTTANGEMLANLLATLSQWERRIIGERTKAALAVKKASGVQLGRPRTLPDNTRRRILRLRRSGKSFAVIADKLNAEGVPTAMATARPGTTAKRPGAKWHSASVRAAYLAAERDAAKPRVRKGATR